MRFEDGKIVGYVTTDSQGKAEVNDLYLGNYVIYETKSPEGWALDTQEHHVSIESQGQTVPVVVENFAAEDAPTTLHLLKVDALDEASMLANATFRVTQTAPAIEDELDPGFNANWEYEVTTDENGIADVSYLPHGRFTIEEIEAPEGFFIPEDATPIAFKVNDQGFIGLDVEGAPFEDTLELAFTNMPTQVDVTKADLTTGTELPGATIVLKDSEGNVVDEWVSITEAHRITHLAPGDYVLSETIAPEGYLLTTDVDVTILPTGEVQKAEMKDDYTKTDFSKTDATTGEEIAGAHLQVIDKDGKVVAEWDTDGELHRINGLEPGDYTLRETTAPDGYEVAEEVTFTVEDNGIVQKVEMKDEKTPDAPEEETPSSSMPKTGDIPWWTYALIGGAALCGGAITLIARKGLHAGKDEDDVDGGDEQ